MSLSSYLLSIIMLTLSLLTNIVRVEMRAAHRSASSSSVVNIVSRKVSPVSSHLTNAHPFTHNGLDYCIRQAQKDDLALINLCNRANLPENYGVEFYLDQLQKFPELTLVAEKRDSKEFIGYALGQIRAKLQFPTSQYFSSMPTEYEGHIASIAIHKDYRGHKVAMNLMNILHERIATEYGVDRVSLYCRVSLLLALNNLI